MFKLNYKPGVNLRVDTLSAVVTYIQDDKNINKNLEEFEKKFKIKLSELQKKNLRVKKNKQLKFFNSKGKQEQLVIHKFKLDEKFTVDYFRNHLAGFIKEMQNDEVQSLHIFIPDINMVKKYFDDKEYFYRSFIEGISLGNYTFDKYKKERNKTRNLSVFIHADDEKVIKSAIAKNNSVVDGIFFTKDLQNEPPSALRPFELADSVREKLIKHGMKVTVYDEKEIKKRNMGGLIAVGQGSNAKPRFIVIEYKPKNKKSNGKKIALVGKGVTFDTGGYCIKPWQGMLEMKADMSGAAVVAGTMLAAAKMNLPLEILGVIPAAENMINGEAMRPGDVVKTASGKTIEVGHTDAEGRMILADALDYASKQKPDEIIDFATLTGACVVALGLGVAGLFTKNDSLADELYKAGMKTYDRLWRLPMWDDYNKDNESKIADVNNDGGRWAGAITAAKFLENFVDKKIPWAHLDIAGPAVANDLTNYNKVFMTGFGVRLMIEYLSNI
ncbi:MAG: leucyl aminopeptidase, partial [Ignavibacteriaceae bacterium]|nr:leucyl aminopeptidase [Ignavibacteriaceae bacterium]